MKVKFLWLMLFVVFSSGLFAQTKIIMNKKGGVYTVPCKVNGLPLKFIFDTGASDVSISLTEAMFMLKNGYLKKEDIGENVYYGIANGDVAKGTKLNIKEIEFAGLKLYNVEASIVHETEAPLLLGQSVIGRLGKIQLDGNELIVLNKGNRSYDYSDTYSSNKKSTETPYVRSFTGTKSVENPYYKRNFTGTKAVFTYSPILKNPDMINSKQIGEAYNNTVTILEKYNNKYYKVKSGNVVGYLWAGWFKN